MVAKAIRAAVIAALIRSGLSVPLERRDNGLAVELTQISETEVVAKVTNSAAEELSLLKWGAFGDDDVVQKVSVYQDDKRVQFTGIHKYYDLSDIPASAFDTLAPGESFSTTINLPAVYDIQGGQYDVITNGAIGIAAPNSTTIESAISFESNKLSLNIAPAAAAKVQRLVTPPKRNKRAVLQNCSGSQRTALTTALSNVVSLANAAATAATSGSSSKFQEYFKTTSSSARSTVAARFKGVAAAAGTSSSAVSYSCTDDRNYCSGSIVAYTSPSDNHIANCASWYNYPALEKSCHNADQAWIALHELTHAPGSYSPGTSDNAYGYSASVALSSSAAILNADTYSLYSNAIYVGC